MGSLICGLLERIDTDQDARIAFFPLLSQGPAVIRFRPRHHGVAIVSISASFIPHDGSEMCFLFFANPGQLGPLSASFLVLCSHGRPEAFEKHNSSDLLCTCNQIAKAVSGASQVFFSRECGIPSFVILHSNG
jgi:hypothetical protein